jgi:hypothetical protein
VALGRGLRHDPRPGVNIFGVPSTKMAALSTLSVVILGERHLVRLVRSSICYYHEDRCHLECPAVRKDNDEEPAQARQISIEFDISKAFTASLLTLQRKANSYLFIPL